MALHDMRLVSLQSLGSALARGVVANPRGKTQILAQAAADSEEDNKTHLSSEQSSSKLTATYCSNKFRLGLNSRVCMTVKN